MGPNNSKVNNNKNEYIKELLEILNSVNVFNKESVKLFNLRKSFSHEHKEIFNEIKISNTRANPIINQNEFFLLSLTLLSHHFAEVLYKCYNISSYNTLILPPHLENIDGNEWAFEVINSKENDDILNKIDKSIPKLKENELMNYIDGVSTIYQNSEIRNELSQMREQSDPEKNDFDNSHHSKKIRNPKLRRESIFAMKNNLNFKNKVKKHGSINSIIPPIYKFSKDLQNDHGENSRRKKISKIIDLGADKQEMEKKTKVKINHKIKPIPISHLLLKKERKRVFSIESVKSDLDKLKKKTNRQNLNINAENNRKSRISKEKSQKNILNKSGNRPSSIGVKSSPTSLNDNKKYFNENVIKKCEMLYNSDRICKKHKNIKTNKVLEAENILMNSKNYFRIDLRLFEDDNESDQESIFKVGKMLNDDERKIEEKCIKTNKDQQQELNDPIVNQAQSSKSMNTLKVSKTDIPRKFANSSSKVVDYLSKRQSMNKFSNTAQ